MRIDPVARLHRLGSRRPELRPEMAVPLGMRRRLEESEITSEHLAGLFVWCSGGPVVSALTWLVLGAAYGVGASAVVTLAPVGFVLSRRGRRTTTIAKLLPDIVDRLGRSLRSGASLRGALAEVVDEAPAAIGDELAPVVRSLDRGQPATAALRDWVARSRVADVRLVGAALALAVEHEAGTTQALEGVSQSLRDRRSLIAEVRALTAQAAVSMQALVALPIAFLLLDAAGSQHAVNFLVGVPLGQVCLLVGVALNLIGWIWMRLLIRRRLPA